MDLKTYLAELKTRRTEAKKLYAFEPDGTKKGESAGSRTEGRDFKREMGKHLRHPGYEIHTAIGKSSNRQRLDGNAHERLAFKMLSFKTNPLQDDLTLVVALNHAFATYAPHFFGEIVSMASSMNARGGGGGAVVVLGTPPAYDAYFDRLERAVKSAIATGGTL